MKLFTLTPLLLALLGSACHSFDALSTNIDSWSFTHTGGTVFDSPFQVTTKQLHFDTGELFGKDIVLEGKVEYFGAAFTHLLLSDREGRVLVVTTELADSYRDFEESRKPKLRILGRLERGKKGLPYLMARAIDKVSDSAQ